MHFLFGFGTPTLLIALAMVTSGHVERLAHPAPWLFWVLAVAQLVLQPKIAKSKDETTASNDAGSAAAIALGQVLSMGAPVMEFFFRAELQPSPGSGWVMAGGTLLLAGTVLRLWSIRVLGRFFTALVQVTAEQTVVDDGPYRHVRHPSYSAVLLSFAATALLFRSVWGAALTVGLVLPVYLYRIRVEERLLLERLGDAYRKYQARTGALLPRLGR